MMTGRIQWRNMLTALALVALVLVPSPAVADHCAEPVDVPGCTPTNGSESLTPDPTGSPSPSESSTPVVEESPTESPSPEPSGPDCSPEQPCTFVLGQDGRLIDWLDALGICAIWLAFVVSVHVVGSWRR